ncbi:hypothetical protein COCMIDRAFT_86517 [Bipolaris oryzae ATCC 44560]|uniref:Uncharacterized protein n=1 Tax=Bipolaris oryzae ATCC 44560 TaxID=930090 RepID=W6ZYL6_COCMI|nr:uncharacterized protein COCMIDRAFT_86517 [Bipolaris oryzae ATCC 44560]EUC48766.1 hypothetical protein COCMIDRAFT_86517 [Bipolaris oryzae ATCC 44560]
MAMTASAASIPQPIPQVTLRIFDDLTGANADTTIPADGTPVTIPSRFAGSALDTGNGDILGTSAQLVKFEDTTKCKLANLNIPSWIIELDGRSKNFVQLDDDITKPVRTWLNGFQFSCTRS